MPGEVRKEKVHRTSAVPLFLDSGAFSLFMKHIFKAKNQQIRYDYFETKEFWEYVDAYAAFVNEHKDVIDHYANIDVIHNPEKSWEVLKYLEDEHGLNPVPVIHIGTHPSWVKKHLDAGYNFIGLGGAALLGDRDVHRQWLNRIFKVICPPPHCLPLVKVHGFAMTNYEFMIRYPWYSVDSASWAKSAAFGSIYVPHKVAGEFTFAKAPYVVAFSWRSPSAKIRNGVSGRHFNSLPVRDKLVILEWLEQIDIPLGNVNKKGKILEEGVINHYGSRGVANMIFFQKLCDWLPEWPWPFRPEAHRRTLGEMLL